VPRSDGVGRAGPAKSTGPQSAAAPRVPWANGILKKYTLTVLQISGCELHKNAFGGRTSYSAPSHLLADIRGAMERRGRKWLGIGGGREGWEGEKMVRGREGREGR